MNPTDRSIPQPPANLQSLAQNSLAPSVLGAPRETSASGLREAAGSYQARMAPWRVDQILFPACEQPRAAVVAFGGFRECGPYHFGALGEALRQSGYLVSLSSLAGHSEHETVPTWFNSQNIMSKAVHDVQEALRHHPKLPLVLLGFSAGGLVALQLAERFWFQPVTAVLCEGLFLQSPSLVRRAYPMLLRLQRKHFSPEKWQDTAARKLLYSPSEVSAGCRTAEWDARPRVPAVTRAALLGLDDFRRETIDLLEHRRLQCPVFLAHGQRDPSSSIAATEKLAAKLMTERCDSELLLMPKSAHSLALGPESRIYSDWALRCINSAVDRCALSKASD